MRIAKYKFAEKLPLTSRFQTKLEPQKATYRDRNENRNKMSRLHPKCTLKFIKPKCLMHKG